ncbi:MAG: periplasmic heavy metal sensor [Ignavibacteria bacterium]|nr:periplasmic heavy metal sensor [Ignavibacteria bacterium]
MKNLVLSLFAAIFLASTISILSQGYGYGNNFGDRDGLRERNRDRIHEKLNLTENQESRIEALRINHQKQMIDFRADLEKKQLEMQELKNNGNYSREEYISLTKEISKVKSEMHLASANHQMDVYDLLDSSQKEIWNQFSKRNHKFEGRYRKHRKMPRFD